MSDQSRWTGDLDEFLGPPSELKDFGWRPLRSYGLGVEADLVGTLSDDLGASVRLAGRRGDDFDLEIVNDDSYSGDRRLREVYLREAGLLPGKYEVKSLWRKGETRRFDRRFKMGRRGERLYGRRDACIKAFALALEDEIDTIVDGQRMLRLENDLDQGMPGALARFVIETHGFIDASLDRRHSKSFAERLGRLGRASLLIPRLTLVAQRALTTNVHGTDIISAYDDIVGIFIVAGTTYTLVTQPQMASQLEFDSASVEGPRLRYVGVIPCEPNSDRKAKKEHK